MTQPLTVATYLETLFATCGKTQTQIAKEIGYSQSNILSMIKKGKTRLPIETIGPLATALGTDPAFLYRLAMTEYYPATWSAIEPFIGGAHYLSANEYELIRLMREAFKGDEIDLSEPRFADAMVRFFEWVARHQAAAQAAARDRYNRSPANARDFGHT